MSFGSSPSRTSASAPTGSVQSADASGAPGDGGKPRLWWVGLVVGLGALGLGCIVGVGILAAVLRRRRRMQQDTEEIMQGQGGREPFELVSMQVIY